MSDKVYSWKEVGQHKSEEDLWVVVGDYVYNLTEYKIQHPGGPIVLGARAGRNASLAFEQASHSVNAKENVMPKFRVGKIDHTSTMEEWQKEAQSSSPSIIVTVLMVIIILATIYLVAS